jgi:hypothetical protein
VAKFSVLHFRHKIHLRERQIVFDNILLSSRRKGEGGDIMVTKKDLVIAVLATFCLTATILMVVPIRSSTNSYDPWLDYNGDGKINLQDLVQFANSYGTTGDPTRNVYVTNWPYSGKAFSMNVSWTNYTTYFSITQFGTGGFSRMFVHLCLNWLSYSGSGSTIAYLNGIQWNVTAYFGAFEKYGPQMGNVTVQQWPQSESDCIIEVKTKADWIESMGLTLESSIPSGWGEFSVYLYFRNE